MINARSISAPSRQQGSILMLSLFMLMVMTMLAIAATKLGTVTLRNVNNMQVRNEALGAAQDAVTAVLSKKFTTDPTAVAGVYVVPVDSGKAYSVQVAKPCIRQVTPIMNTVLDTDKPEDLNCWEGSLNSASACSNTVWEVTATVDDGWFGTNVRVSQGTGIRMDNGSANDWAAQSALRCN